MKNIYLYGILLLGSSTLMLTACGGSDNSAESSNANVPAAELVALEERQQDIYETNCAVCHSMVGSGAPQSGTVSDWQERSGKGMDAMLNNAMDGFQAMPAMGGCFDCDEDDFKLLITFMTSGMLK